MEKKMADKPVERPTFFEIFKARCSESDLGPISLNWFEELSTEALPYESDTSERPEYRAVRLEQSASKTPRRKPFTCSQLASTPVIFKEQSITLPLLSSPIKELGQKKTEAGKDSLVNKDHRSSPHFMKTKLDQISPLNTSLSVSSAALRGIYRTPQRNNIPVARGSLFCTPKLLEVKTPTCISEGLGAEVDPDMSWSSSLATPPTLSATVIIARGNDSISGAKQHDERIAMVLHSFFGSHGKRPEKNDINVLSIPERVNINARVDGKDHELEKILDGSFGEMNSLENRFHIPVRSDRNQITHNSLEDGERYEMRIDMPDAGEHVLSVCHTSGEHLQDVTMTNSTKKTHFDKMETILLQETNEIRGNFKDASSACDRELDSPRCEIFTTNMSNNKIPKLLENRKFTKEDMPSTFTSEWSQLNLSGLDVTQLEKNSTSDKYSPSSFCNKKRSENKLHANLSTFETSLLNTSSLIKAEKLLNINWSEHMEDETKNYEKHSTSETSIMHSVDLGVQDPSLVKVCTAEKVSEMHFLDCSSFLMENTNFTGYTEVCTSCFHKDLKELSKSSITDVTSHPVLCNDSIPNNPDGTKWSTSNESTPMRSCLKNTSLLSSLKKRSKRFIYTINAASPRQKEKVKEIEAGPSIHSASSHSELESCPFKSPDTVSNDDQDLLVSSAERKSLQSDTEESSMLLSKYATRADRIDNSPNSSLKNKMIHLDVLKSNRREHQPASSLECSETSNTLKECLVVSSNSKNVLSVKHKVITTACLLTTKHSEMDFGRTEHVVQCPKKDEMDMYGNVNPHNDTVILQTFKNQLGEPSSDNKQLVEIEQEQVSMRNRYFNTSINCDIHKHNSVCCNRTKSEDENDATGLLLAEEWKTVTLPPLVIQPNKNSSTTTLIRETKRDTVQFSKVIVADQETESNENGDDNLQTPSNNMVTIESSEKLFDHKDCGSLQAVISEKSTLPQLALKIGPEQIVSDFVTNAPEPNVEDKDFVKVIKFPSKRVTSDKYLYSKKHLCLDIKSKENPEDKEKWSGDTNFNGQCLNKSFGGFQTASNKQIKVSEKSITKGKMLFKDMEDECLKDFSGEGIKNISNQITKKNINIVNNKLDTNYSHGLDSQASLIEPKNAQSILPESTDSSLQSLHRNQPRQLNQTLTASQEAEITELSNILEETNSQFEFTQFRKQSNMVQNNSSQLSGSVDKNETTNFKDISAMWQDTDLDYIFETEAQMVNDKSSSKHTDINEESTEMHNVSEEREIFQKNNCVEFTSTNLCINANKIPLVSSFSVSTQDNFSNFAGFSSAGGKKINISNEALIRAAKLFSNLDDDDIFKPIEINSRSHYSDRYKTSRRDVSRCVAERDHYCGESVKDANIEHQNTLKNNEENINTFMKIYGENQGENTTNIGENDTVSSSTKISNLGVIKYSVYKMKNGLSSSENNNPSLNSSKKLHESDSQSQYSLQEGVSDLTCLAEVSKTEEILTLNISDETELDPNKSEQKIKNVYFRTASSSNRSVSQAPLHLFETCTEKDLNNISSNSNSQMTNSINKKERNATSRKRNINVNQNKLKIGSDHQQNSIQQDTDFERKNIKQNNGFRTANGKKIIITDESLSKAKQFFAEKNDCPENMDDDGNFEDSEFHPCNKDFIKDCELFAKNTPNYDQEMLTLTGKLVSKELDDPCKKMIDDYLIKQPEDVETVKELSVEVHLSSNLDKEPEEHSETSFSKKPVDVAFGKSDIDFYIGNGKKHSVSEASLFEARKLIAEGNLENIPRKNYGSKSASIVSDTDQPTARLSDTSFKYRSVEHPMCINMKNILTVETDEVKNQDSLYLTHRNILERSSFHLKDNSKGSDFQHLNDLNHDVNCFSEKMNSVSQDQQLVSLISDKNNLLNSEETFENESYVKENCDLKFLDAKNVLKISATEESGSNSKFKDVPVAFSTAKGKPVTVSYEALKRVRQMFPENCDKSMNQNTETKSETNEIGANGSEILDSAKCPTSVNSSEVDKSETHNSAMSHFPYANENSYKYGQALQHDRNTSADIGSEPSHQMACFQVNDTFSGICRSPNKLNHHHSDFSTGNYGVFSTANGKRVHLSEDSLKKARCLSSEIKNNLSDQQCVSELKCDYDVFSVGDQVVKFVGPGSTSDFLSAELLTSQKRDPKPELISKTTFGFNTASGKRVLVSENAFQKVKQVFNNSKYHFADRLNSRQDPVIALKSSINYAGATKAADTVCLKPKIQDTHNEELDLTNSYPVEIKALQNMCNSEIPMCAPRSEKDEHLTLINSFTFAEDTQLFKKEHHSLTRMEIEAVSCNTPTNTKLDVYHLKCSQSSEEYVETEAVESAKAFMEDKFTNSGIKNNTKKSLFICRKIDKNCPLNIRTGKRHMEERASLGEPPIKRQLLPEFDRTENTHKSLKASKSTPDGIIKDRRKFMYHIPLKPETCAPFSATKERQEIKNPNITVLDQNFKEFKSKSDVFQHHLLRQSLSGTSGFFTPFKKISTEESERRKNLPLLSKTAKTFVPPFKVKSTISTNQQHVSKRLDSLINTTMNRDKELKDITMQQSTSETEVQSQEKDYTTQVAPCNLGNNMDGDSDLMEMIANLHCARNLQEMRIRKKQRQNIHPQPGNLYLMKTSAAKRISLKAAVEEKTPSTYSMEQLYMYGVSKDCINVNSINAESFQFLILDFFSKEYLVAEHGIQLADGGWLIPTDKGMAGKEEFYRALCDTPGVDPKLITETWVYNHYRWIVWKLAAMEVSFPREFANRCLTPERVLFQLKYRYDLEIDKSQRSAIKKIVERDDTPAKTLILCVSKIILLNANIPDVCSNKTIVENKKEATVIEVTDGWYGIRALLDPPLQALLHGRRLTVGQKIIVHGAELVGSQDACTPLEIPDSLMLKISANSTRRARWHAKLGFHRDPRPFSLPLSSLFGEGGTVGCIDIVIQRTYPIQWVEKMPTGSYVFRNGRAEEREAAKHAENRQKHLEALFSQIQMKFEQHEDKPHRRALRSHTLTREQIRILEDGAELYEAIQNASDPSYVEGYLSEEQLKALNTHRQILNDKKQAEIQAEFKKAIESAEREEHGCSNRDVSTVWKLRVIDYRKRETAIILSIWRPLSDICSLLKEGGRYRIYQLTASRSKGKPDTVNCTLTATKRTQYLQLQASQEVLLEIYMPRKALQFSMLLDPSFRPACAEVDLVGFIISVSKKTGFTTLVYLSDEDHNLVAIKFWTDLKQLAIEDIIKPFTLISASNLQWRSEFKSDIPTLFAGDLSIFSASPKDSYLQERLNKLKNTTENVSCFFSDAEHKLMNLLQKNSPQQYNLPKECGLNPLSPSWKSGLDTGNKPLISSPSSEIKCQSSLSTNKHDLKLVLQSSAQMTPHISYSKESPKNCKKRRKALDLLSQIPSPPPVTPINSFVSPSLKKAFQPPRSSGVQYDKSLKRTNHNSGHINAFKGVNETARLPDNDLVADEELAMINTQVLLYNLQEEKKTDCVGESANAISTDPSDHLLLKNNCLMSLMETKTSQNSTDGAEALEKDTRETEGSLAVQKKLQRQRKRKCY